MFGEPKRTRGKKVATFEEHSSEEEEEEEGEGEGAHTAASGAHCGNAWPKAAPFLGAAAPE